MNDTLKKRYEESKADVQKLWAQFGEQKAKVEADGAKSEDVTSLNTEHYEPYLKAVDQNKKDEAAYRQALEMSADGPSDTKADEPKPDEPTPKAPERPASLPECASTRKMRPKASSMCRAIAAIRMTSLTP